MNAKWKLSNTTLTVELGSELVMRLFAIGFLIGGGYFAYYLILGISEYATGFLRGEPGIVQALVSSVPGILLTIVMMLVFGIPGILMFFGRKRVVMDRGSGMISELTDYGMFKRKQEHAVTDFQTVEVAFAKNTSPESRTQLFDVSLKGKGRKSVLVAVMDDKEIPRALELAKQIAALLDYKMREDIGGYSPTAPSGASDEPRTSKSLLERMVANWRNQRESSLPKVLLGSVMWQFAGSPYASRSSFDKAVRKYQTDHGEQSDNWEPDAVAVAVPRIAIQYECQERDGDWAKPIVELTAEDGKQFTNSELFFRLHNAVVEKLRTMDNNHLEGLELVEPAWKKNAPLYVINQVE